MIKKLALASIIIAISIGMISCSGVSKKEYNNLKKVQENMVNQISGHFVISSSVNGDTVSDANVTDFVYKLNDKGVMEYCQTQQDGNNKLVFVEYGDGEQAEQWLLGNGWSAIEPMSYTKDNQHKYLTLLTNAYDKKMIANLKKENEMTNTIYTLDMDVKKLNKAVYKDAPIEIVSQSIQFLVNEKGELICYNDTAVIYDKETQTQAEYLLEVQLSEHNAVAEVKRPEIRVNAIVQSGV